MINILKHDIRMCFNKKLVIGACIILIILAVLPIGGGSLLKIQQFTGEVIPLIAMYISALLFSSEFEQNTYKTTFTGRYSRLQILLIKLLAAMVMAIMMAGFLCAVFKAASLYDGVKYGLMDALHVLNCLVLFTLLVSGVGFLAAVICKNFIGTFLVLFVLFYDFFNRCLVMVAEGIRNEGMKNFILHIPLYDAISGLRRFSYSSNVIISIFIASMISITITGVILHNRDLA